ncbi:MAG: hypothetical protein AAF517_00760 [Planctomycetota bacterium]
MKLAILALICLSGCASPFVDIYGGAAIPNLDETGDEFVSGRLTTGGQVGARVGTFLPSPLPIRPGIALDFSRSFMENDSRGEEFENYLLSFLVMARLFPDSTIQPYAALGPTLGLGEYTAPSYEDSAFSVGADFRAGIAADFLPIPGIDLAPFLEYRAIWIEHDFDAVSPLFAEDRNRRLKGITHGVMLGLSLSF